MLLPITTSHDYMGTGLQLHVMAFTPNFSQLLYIFGDGP
jgi:hypothetical protein